MLPVTKSPEESKEWKLNWVLADPANAKVKEISKAPWEMSQLSIIWGSHYAFDLKAESKRLQNIKIHLGVGGGWGGDYLSYLFISRRISSIVFERLQVFYRQQQESLGKGEIFFFFNI